MPGEVLHEQEGRISAARGSTDCHHHGGAQIAEKGVEQHQHQHDRFEPAPWITVPTALDLHQFTTVIEGDRDLHALGKVFSISVQLARDAAHHFACALAPRRPSTSPCTASRLHRCA
jgi:hypothetical protein